MAGDFNQERLTETYKSLINLSIEGFRYLALINGGAVVALLTYLGNVTKNGGNIPDVSCPMLFFLLGLLSCGFAMFFAYFTQLRLLNELLQLGQLAVRHVFTLWAAMASFVLSLCFFGVGAWLAVEVFGGQG